MEADSPASRVGRTLWTVWAYISEAVTRFFRSESTNISENELVSHQPSENLTPNTTWLTERGTDREEVKEEHALASVCQLSSPRSIVAWETCVTDGDVQAHKVGSQDKTEQGKEDEIEESQQAQGSKQCEFSQAVDEDAGLVTADTDGKGECEDKMLCSNRRIDEALDSNEVLQTASSRLAHDVMTGDLERDGSAKSEEAPEEDVAQREDENLLESTDAEEKDEKNLGGWMAQDQEVDQNMSAALKIDQERTKEKTLQDFEEESPPQHNIHKADADWFFESGNDGPRQGGNQLLSNEKLPEQEQDQSVPETEQKPEDDTERENAIELEDTELALEEPQSLSVDEYNEKISITELQVVEFSYGEQVDVRTFSEVQTERKYDRKMEASEEEEEEKSDLDTTDNEVEKECVGSFQTEEVETSGDVCIDDKHSMDATYMSPSINPNTERERIKEASGQCKNIYSWVCEGQRVVQQEPPLCEEVRGGVPEHNNEPGGDENTTQRLLEERDSTETNTMELREELERTHSSVSSLDADLLPATERVGEEQDSLGDILCDISHCDIGGPCLNEDESQQNVETSLGEQEVPEVPAGSWKGEDTYLTDGTTKKQPDETEVLSYETQMDYLNEADAAGYEESPDTEAADKVVQFADEISRALEAEVQKMAEMSFPKEFGRADNLEQSSCSVPSLQEESYESIFTENSAEAVLFEDSGDDFHVVETIQMEKANCTAEEDTQEDKLEREKSQEHIDLATEWDEKVEILSAESETVETQDQLWDEAQGINSEDGEVEFETKDKNVLPTEATNTGEKRSEDTLAELNVTDDEILDLWIQTTLLEDTGEHPVDEEVCTFLESTDERPVDEEVSTFLEDTDEHPADEEVSMFLEDTDERPAHEEVSMFLEDTDERPADKEGPMFLEDTDKHTVETEVSMLLNTDEHPVDEEVPTFLEDSDQRPADKEASTLLEDTDEHPVGEEVSMFLEGTDERSLDEEVSIFLEGTDERPAVEEVSTFLEGTDERPAVEEVSTFLEGTDERPAVEEVSTFLEGTDERPADKEVPTFLEDTDKHTVEKEVSTLLEDAEEHPVDEEVSMFLEGTDECPVDEEVSMFLEGTDERPVDEEVSMFLEGTDERSLDEEVSIFLEGTDERPAVEEVSTFLEGTDERPADKEVPTFLEDTDKHTVEKEVSTLLEDADEHPVDEEVSMFLEGTDECPVDEEVSMFLEGTDERPVDEDVSMFLEGTDERPVDEEVSMFLEDTDEHPVDEEGPQSVKQVDEEIKLRKDEPGEIPTVPTEQNEEPLVEFSSGDFANNVEMLSVTLESVSWDLEPMISTETDSIDQVCTPQPDSSEGSVLLPDSESEDAVREMTPEQGQAYLGEVESVTEDELQPDSGLNSPTRLLNEDQEETDEKSAEEGRSEMTNVDVGDDAELHLTKPNPSCNVEDPAVEDEHLSDSLDEIEQPESGSSSESQEDTTEFLLESNRTDVEEEIMSKFEDLIEVNASTLDVAAQRSRILVKNPRVRPPTDPRTLLNMPSLEPSPPPQRRIPVGLPMGGLGIGIKLPGLGAGFPVLKKVEPKQEPETKPDEMDDKSNLDEAGHKPKWMPPRHPGFGNPLMSELKAKLKKAPLDN